MVFRKKEVREILLIVQARVGSTRLPRKVLLDLCGKSVIQRVLERIKNSVLVDKFILAMPDTPENDILSNFAKTNDFYLFRGNENDVLDRFYQATRDLCNNQQDELIIIRVCADNPFVDSYEIDRLIGFFLKGDYDYAFNHIPALDNMYPDGLGAEILKFSVLKYIWEKADRLVQKEHVTKYIWDNMKEFRIGVLKAPPSIAYPEIKLDVDTEEDFKWLEKLYRKLIKRNGEVNFSGAEIVACAQNIS